MVQFPIHMTKTEVSVRVPDIVFVLFITIIFWNLIGKSPELSRVVHGKFATREGGNGPCIED